MPAELLFDFVFEEAMHENHVSPREFLLARHLLFDELAVVNDELHIEALHMAARSTLAAGRLLDAAQPLSESKIRRLDRILEERSVYLILERVAERRVALVFCETGRRTERAQPRVHGVVDDGL